MPSNHLILCHPLLLPPSIFPSIRVFSNELDLRIRWPKYWSFSFNISPSSEYSGLISFMMDYLNICKFMVQVLLNITGQDIDSDSWDIEWFPLETKRDHSVLFEIASKYCILGSSVYCDGYSISSKGFLPTNTEHLGLPFPLQEVEKKEVHEESKDECHQPYSDDKFNFNELEVDIDPDGTCGYSHAKEDENPTNISEKQNDHDDLKGPEVVAPRFSRQMPQMVEDGVPQNSLDDYYLTYSVLPSLSDSFWPYRSTVIFSPEDVDVSYARDVTKNLADLEDEENQDIISSSPSCLTICSPNPTNLSMEQLVVEENEVHPDSLDECYLAASIGHHLEDSCPPSRSVSFPTEKREVFLALDVNGDTWEDSHQEPVSFPGSEVPTSQAQLQKSTHMTDCLQWQLDQHLDCGDSKAILGLSSINWAFTTNPDSENQGPLFLELDASITMKNPPKLEGEGSTASTREHPVYNKIKGLSVLKQKILRRKLLFGKWRLACRFPGLQA
ncbi:hypothetical protein FD755_001450 [Muntiacus reevesi]|uniref:Olduvai domain-containing protein n=1 Tax=Muntiacus reevesi TaxID=9886 RepID=A0A5J5N3E6_MUNRE|nr:hypothetical protein FD755_001450 [Muntiacus reevesi]